MKPVGDIMKPVGGYHEYRGRCSVPCGTQITKEFSPHGTEYPPRYSRYVTVKIQIWPFCSILNFSWL